MLLSLEPRRGVVAAVARLNAISVLVFTRPLPLTPRRFMARVERETETSPDVLAAEADSFAGSILLGAPAARKPCAPPRKILRISAVSALAALAYAGLLRARLATLLRARLSTLKIAASIFVAARRLDAVPGLRSVKTPKPASIFVRLPILSLFERSGLVSSA